MICMAKYLREATETYVVGIAGPYHTELKKWCHEIVEIPNRDALLSLDVITSFSGATYILDIFSRFCCQSDMKNMQDPLWKC